MIETYYKMAIRHSPQIPNSMSSKYGDYSHIAHFKVIHSGSTFELPHYNFDVETYCKVYTDYLKLLINADTNIQLFYLTDKNYDTDISNQASNKEMLIEEFILKKYNSQQYVYYVKVDDENKCDIGQSLITKSPFCGKCNICYQTTSLKHYYECNIIDKTSHHGICGDCYMSWHSANSSDTCPMCRACKKQ